MFNLNIYINVMIWKDNTIGITKRDILFLINIVKDISAINKDNTLDNNTKDKEYLLFLKIILLLLTIVILLNVI